MQTIFDSSNRRMAALVAIVMLLGLSFLASTVQAGQFSGWLRSFTSVASIGVAAPALPQPSDAASLAIDIRVNNAANLGAWEFDLDYDPALVRIDGMSLNPVFALDPACDPGSQRCLVQLGPLDVATGTTAVGAISYGTPGGLNGNAILATLQLTPLGCPGTTALTVNNLLATDVDAISVSTTAVSDNLTLQSPPLSATIALANDDIHLSWVSPQCSYALYRDPIPYSGLTLLQSLPTAARDTIDLNAAVAPFNNYYYTLVGLDSTGTNPVDETAVGVFHFSLNPGS